MNEIKKNACASCGITTRELRLGHCWDCATAESIIEEGVDMYENGLNGRPATTSMQKLKLLIEKGLFRSNE